MFDTLHFVKSCNFLKYANTSSFCFFLSSVVLCALAGHNVKYISTLYI